MSPYFHLVWSKSENWYPKQALFPKLKDITSKFNPNTALEINEYCRYNSTRLETCHQAESTFCPTNTKWHYFCQSNQKRRFFKTTLQRIQISKKHTPPTTQKKQNKYPELALKRRKFYSLSFVVTIKTNLREFR